MNTGHLSARPSGQPAPPPLAPQLPQPDAVTASAARLQRLSADAPAGETWRLFIAVELPEPVRGAIAALRTQLPPPIAASVRWVRPENIHVTLQFLGDIEPSRAPDIAAAIAEAASRSGRIGLLAGPTGAFPSVRSPKILWVGFKGEPHHLVQLQGRLEGAMTGFGFEQERARYIPHASAGRLIRDTDRFAAARTGQAWAAAKLPPTLPTFTVSEVTLFRSRLGLDGPDYERLSVAQLG